MPELQGMKLLQDEVIFRTLVKMRGIDPSAKLTSPCVWPVLSLTAVFTPLWALSPEIDKSSRGRTGSRLDQALEARTHILASISASLSGRMPRLYTSLLLTCAMDVLHILPTYFVVPHYQGTW